MSGERVIYVDSSAIVKLAAREPESVALRRYLRSKRPLVVSALARTEVTRAFLPVGRAGVRRAEEVLSRFALIRINDRILREASRLHPSEVRTLDAIHLATAICLGSDLSRVCTYDLRMAHAARALGMTVIAPG